MDKPFPTQLGEILRHLTIESEASFSFAGRQFPVPSVAAMESALSHPLPADPLVCHLQLVLYSYCYSRPFAGAPLPDLNGAAAMDAVFVAQLSAANQSRELWDHGWEIYLTMPDGRVFVRKGDRQHAAAPGEFIFSAGQSTTPQPGTLVSVLQRRESAAAQPGFYFVYGEVPNDLWDDYTLTRFYFHLTSAGAPVLIGQITRLLNSYAVPFQFKALNAPSAYDRTDSAVLYVARRYYHPTACLLLECGHTFQAFLKPGTPLFTRKLMEGVGIADDPGNGESFGMHRCRLVAEGLADAFRRAATTPELRLQAVQLRFSMNGINFHLPHTGAGLLDYPAPVVQLQEAS